MKTSVIKKLIADRLTGLDLKNVYRSERYIKDEKAFKSAFLNGTRLEGAWMRRLTRKDTRHTNFDNKFTTWRLFLIEGFSNEGDSEALLDERIDDVIDAFVDVPQLATALHIYSEEDAGARLIDQSPHMLGGYLFHLATIELNLVDEGAI